MQRFAADGGWHVLYYEARSENRYFLENLDLNQGFGCELEASSVDIFLYNIRILLVQLPLFIQNLKFLLSPFFLSQIFYTFATKREAMTSIEDKIWEAIQAKERGSIFFASDFTSYGEAKTIGKSLERLTAKENIVRLARGIYTYPKIDSVLGLGVLMPSIEEIAETIARRDKARIVPTGIYAMNKLGISTQVPMNIIYLTDGAPRKINLGNGRSIQFKYTTPKNLSFTNPLAMLTTFALKAIGKENVTSEIILQIKKVLQQEQKDNILADEALMPVWIRNIARQAYE